MEMPWFASVSLVVLALSGVIVALTFTVLVKALKSNTESIKTLVDHMDSRVDTLMDSVQKSIADINGITESVNHQMERVDQIVNNIEVATKDARTSVHMVNATVVPILANMHGIVGGLRKGVETWRETGAREEYEPDEDGNIE
jgi:uncharacterized protein YoxC